MVLRNQAKLGGFLLACCSCSHLRCPTDFLLELTEQFSIVFLETLTSVVLGDFNIHAKAALNKTTQLTMATMATMGLSQVISGPTHQDERTLDFVFYTDRGNGHQKVEDKYSVPIVMVRSLSGRL